MRKIIIAICGSFLLFDFAHADIDTHTHRSAIERWSKEWIDYGSHTIDGVEDIKKYYNIETYPDDDFQYVDIVAAIEMYEHGAKFCSIQLQHNWGKWEVFIEPGSCRTICNDGYYGTKCDSNSLTAEDCEYSDLTSIFSDSKPWDKRDIDGFGSSDTYAAIFEAVSVTNHRIDVALVNFSGDDEKRKEISTISGTKHKLSLCAQGYKLQNGECVISEICNDELAKLGWCESWRYNQYESTEHDLVKVGDCKQYRCKGAKGFKKDSYSCIPCPTTKTQGVNPDTGVCIECTEPNQMFNGESCVDYKYKLYAKDLLDGMHNVGKCWIKSRLSEYKDCVLCNKGQHWNGTGCENKNQSAK